MLAVSLRAFEETAYRFCSTAGCAVVYYAEDGTHVFSVDDVRERVYQKEPSNPDILACYCFRRTIGEVVAASQEGRSAILRDITDGMRAGQCACDLRNPQGSCCLGNVRALAGKPESTAAGLPA